MVVAIDFQPSLPVCNLNSCSTCVSAGFSNAIPVQAAALHQAFRFLSVTMGPKVVKIEDGFGLDALSAGFRRRRRRVHQTSRPAGIFTLIVPC